MATIKQQRVAKNIKKALGNKKPITGGEIVENSGYGKSMKLYPKRIIQSKGVKEETKPIIEQLEEERKRAIKLLKTKISKAQYHQLVDAIDKLTKNIQLLSGGATERVEGFTWEK